MKHIFAIIIFFIPLFVGCQEQKKQEKITQEDLIRVNRQLVNHDANQIKAYLKEQKLDMTETQTGMWYLIHTKHKTPLAATGQIITLKYKSSLLDGTECYNSDQLGLKTFLIGQGGVESGLEDAVLMLRKGDKAKFIFPPHLAYGLAGDNNRIPARATIIYDVEVIDIKNKP